MNSKTNFKNKKINAKEEIELKLKLMVGAIVALCFVASICASATERQSVWKGNMIGFVQFFSEDILYLENEINKLMSECGKELN